MTEPASRQRPRSLDPSRWSKATRLGVAAISGLALNASFPPIDAGWAAPFAFAGFTLALIGARGLAGAAVGAVFGVTFMGPLVYWLWISAGVMAWVGVVLLQTAWFVVAGWACARASRSKMRVLTLPLAWTAVELMRANVPLGGFTWGDVGLTQLSSPLGAYAPYGGVHLVGAVVVALGVVIAEFAVRTRVWMPGVAVASALLVLAFVLPAPQGAQSGTFKVAAVQGNVPKDQFRIGRGREGPEDEIIVRNHLDASIELVGTDPPDLVVWPENSFDRDPRDNPSLFDPTKALIARVGAPFLIGAIMNSGDTFTNSNLHIAPDGTIIGRYDKVHLVPFGEYVPAQIFRKLVPILDEEIPVNGQPGTEVVVFNVSGVQVGSVICFESAYPALVRRSVKAGAEIMVVTTNNASFGTTPAAAQHLAQSRMRAIENGRSVVHTAIAGISALITPDGRVIEDAPLFTREVLRASLPLHRGLTPYSRWGNFIEALLILLGLGVTIRRVRS